MSGGCNKVPVQLPNVVYLTSEEAGRVPAAAWQAAPPGIIAVARNSVKIWRIFYN